MVKESEFYFPSTDGKTSIHVNQWTPEGQNIRGVVQIAHGVAEYGKRYEDFACFLVENGFAAVANDHLGHGKSLIADSPMLYLGEKDGWLHLVDDMEELHRRTAEKFPGAKYFLLGHSMGSFAARSHLIRYRGSLDGCIICGTGFPSAFDIAAGKIIAWFGIKRSGKKGFSAAVDKLTFDSYNRKFAPNRTALDWLSVNEENVDAYIADPLCGGRTTLGLFSDMLKGLSYITKQSNIDSMDKDQPVLFISGAKDAVGDMGRGVIRTYDCFKQAGLKDVEIRLYEGMRHEILNEKDHKRVYDDVLEWLNLHLN